MEDGIEQVPDAPPGVETPAMFLAEVGKALSEEEGGDVELADILTEHLLTTTPAKDAVAQAKNAISKLAGTRAASKAETDHG